MKRYFFKIYISVPAKKVCFQCISLVRSEKQGFHGLSFMLAQLPSWHNFPLEQLPPGTTSQITTSHWHNFPIHTTSLFIQLPYGTTYPWYNFPMAQLTPGTTYLGTTSLWHKFLWHNFPRPDSFTCELKRT